MSFSPITFVVTDGDPFNHFAKFAEVLNQKDYPVHFCRINCTRGGELDRCKPFASTTITNYKDPLEKLMAIKHLGESCLAQSALVITGISNPISAEILQLLEKSYPEVPHAVYYHKFDQACFDEWTLPMLQSKTLIFAPVGMTLRMIDERAGKYYPTMKKIHSLGYNPIEIDEKTLGEAEKIKKMRTDTPFLQNFKTLHHINDEEILTFIGDDKQNRLSDLLVILGRVPEKKKNLDGKVIFVHGKNIKNDQEMVEKWLKENSDLQPMVRFIFSEFATNLEPLVLASKLLYADTNVGILGVYSEVPVWRVAFGGDKITENELGGIIASPEDFIKALNSDFNPSTVAEIGFRTNWREKLEQSVLNIANERKIRLIKKSQVVLQPWKDDLRTFSYTVGFMTVVGFVGFQAMRIFGKSKP